MITTAFTVVVELLLLYLFVYQMVEERVNGCHLDFQTYLI